MGARLEVAYQQFRRWRWENKETCKITEFALRTFKIQTSLLLLSMRFLNTNLYIEIKYVIYMLLVMQIVFFHQAVPQPPWLRLKQYPGLQGQGHDCIVIHKWLSHLCKEISLEDLEPKSN